MNQDITGEKRGFFGRTLEEIAVGDTITYHIGEYAQGPHKSDAFIASNDGLCLLFQRKLGGGQFAYIAYKTKRKKK